MQKTEQKLEINLPKLQDLMKRDPSSYKDEFSIQYQHYLSCLKMFTYNPSQDPQRFLSLTNFVAHVGHLYGANEIPGLCRDLLSTMGSVLRPEVRLSLGKALILMRNKGQIFASDFFDDFFKLYSLEDCPIRKLVFHFIVKVIQKPMKGDHIVREKVLERLNESPLSLRVTVELCRRGTWKDEKAINLLADICLSHNPKMSIIAIAFFIGQAKNWMEDEQKEKIDDENKAARAAIHAHRIGKKTAARKRLMERKLKRIETQKTRQTNHSLDYEPLYFIYDPQKFAEKLYRKLESSRDRFEVRIMLMNLISRLIAHHELTIPQFYPFFCRYLRPRTEEITKILVYCAQSVHAHVDHSLVVTLIRTIADNFISDANSGEAIAIGLNTVREICARSPLAMTEELLRDLVNYRNYKHKSASMSAKSLITLFRTVNPKLLHRKDRGRPVGAVKDYIPGAGILPLEEGGEVDSEMDEEERAREVTRSRILGDDDLRAVKEHLGEEEEDEEEEEAGHREIVAYSDVVHLHKRTKQTREEKVAEQKKGGTVRRKRGGKKSTKKSFRATNREKQKLKNFSMVRPKILARRRKSGKKR